MKAESYQTKPSFTQALFCVSFVLLFLFLGLVILKASLHSIMLISIFWVVMHAVYLDSNPERLKDAIKSAIQKCSSVFFIFILIGAVIAAFTISGAIPTLMYYGLYFISPQSFLPIGMLLCTIMSLSIGTCWGTIGTMGIALIGVATIFHIPLPIAAGMIVSGAYCGDKFSPISDTTILSALTTDTDLYRHIKAMSYTIIPAYIISLGIFWVTGSNIDIQSPEKSTELTSIQQLLCGHFHIGIITLIPMIVMLFLSIRKKPAELSMLASVMVALFIATFFQDISLADVLDSLFSGPKIKHTGSNILDIVLSRGGIQSMLWSMSLTLLILALGGLLESYQFITTLFERLVRSLKTPLSLVFATMSTSVLCNMLIGEAYLSIILTSRVFKKSFKNMKLDSCVLSKAIEEGSTLSTPLIPWTTSGAFITTSIGVLPVDYIYWSFFNWVAPLIFLIFVALNFLNIKMYRTKSESIHSPRLSLIDVGE